MKKQKNNKYKLFIVSLGTILAVALVLFMLGVLIPNTHEVTLSHKFNYPKDKVWYLLNNLDEAAEAKKDFWAISKMGKSDLGNDLWIVIDNSGNYIKLENTFGMDNEILVIRIVESTYSFSGHWAFELTGDGKATVLTVTETGVIKNPYYRLLYRYILGYEYNARKFVKTMERYLDNE